MQGEALVSEQQCFWKVRVWDKDGQPGKWSEVGQWRMGLLKPEDWKAKWITAGTGTSNGLPVFRKAFDVKKPVQSALVYICGLGHYELRLDGKKVGDRFLDPAWSAYEKTVYYTTYDITKQLRRGSHAFEVLLGKGFYNTIGDRRVHGVKADRPLKLILQARVRYADGTDELIATDLTWRTASGPITHSAILGGEDYDARLEPKASSQGSFEEAFWHDGGCH